MTIDGSLRSSHVTEDEVLAALRASGVDDRRRVHTVVLETDASFSVIESQGPNAASTLQHVRGNPEGEA